MAATANCNYRLAQQRQQWQQQQQQHVAKILLILRFWYQSWLQHSISKSSKMAVCFSHIYKD
jgi:hypothetical protein